MLDLFSPAQRGELMTDWILPPLPKFGDGWLVKQRLALRLAAARVIHALDLCAPLILVDGACFGRKPVEKLHHLVMGPFDQVVGE